MEAGSRGGWDERADEELRETEFRLCELYEAIRKPSDWLLGPATPPSQALDLVYLGTSSFSKGSKQITTIIQLSRCSRYRWCWKVLT